MKEDMKRGIVLTIGIPVFNGEQLISRTLDSILSDLKNVDCSCLEVLVSDNASTDNTETILQEQYRHQFGAVLSYHRNSENLGFDRNVDLVVRRATGSHVWLLGCGEVIKPGALDVVLSRLQDGEYKNIVLNYEIYSEKTEQMEVFDNFALGSDVTFDSADTSFQALASWMMPISANIVSRDSWRAVEMLPLRQLGWCHIERLIALMAADNEKKTLCISVPCFTLWREEHGWWDGEGRLFVNTVTFGRIVKCMREFGYSKATIGTFLRRQYATLSSIIYESKLQGLVLDRKLLASTIIVFYSRPTFWLFYLPILLLPYPCYRALRWVYRGWKSLTGAKAATQVGRL
ncbi:glycosyltransferase family 2 protein [Planctomycetota bacterium]